MKPEKAIEKQRPVLETDITEALQRKRAAEAIGDLIGAEIHEEEMNDALKEYRDLTKAEAREAYDSSNIR